MKKLSFLLTAALLIACSVAFAQRMKPVIITGNIINGTEKSPKALTFNFLNPVIDKAPSVEVTGSEQFRVQQDMLYTQNMTIHYANYFINLYVKPGDSVNLNIDASLVDKPNFEWLKITGDGARIKSQLNLCASYIYKNIKMHDYNMQLPPDAMLAMVKQDYDRYLTTLNKYAAENNLDQTVINWAKADIKYLISNTIDEYSTYTNLTIEEKRARLTIFTDPFFDMYNPDNFQSMLFPYHLANYAGKFKRFYGTANEKTTPAALLKETVAILTKLPIGECRDFILYRQLKPLNDKNPGILASVKNANAYFSTAVYSQQFQKLALGDKSPVFPATKISGVKFQNNKGENTDLQRENIVQYLAAKYPGKVLYVDVYATWCAPCLEEMNSTPAIYTAMKGKDVVFINLCLASTEAGWKKLVKERDIEGENYFFSNDATKLFMSTYELHGYPAYLLINKKGEIATTNAPRPSEKNKLIAAVDDLLKK